MNARTEPELEKISATDDLYVSPFCGDGKTYGTPTWVWLVTVDAALYVRAYHGQKSRWYGAALQQRAGRITAAGLTKDVTFEPIEGTINETLDAAYREKYRGSLYLEPMIGARARAATIKVSPKAAGL